MKGREWGGLAEGGRGGRRGFLAYMAHKQEVCIREERINTLYRRRRSFIPNLKYLAGGGEREAEKKGERKLYWGCSASGLW